MRLVPIVALALGALLTMACEGGKLIVGVILPETA